MADEVKMPAGSVPAYTPSVMTDKKALLKWRTNHDLHVLMIMNRHGLTKGQASVQAYAEGVEGLSKRLG